MRIISSISSGDKFEKELSRIASGLKRTSDVKSYVDDAVAELRDRTPKDTGETSRKWGSVIGRKKSGLDIAITNDSMTKDGIPIPILLKNGHGTGTGGYVPPNDFISPVAEKMVKNISNSLERRLR